MGSNKIDFSLRLSPFLNTHSPPASYDHVGAISEYMEYLVRTTFQGCSTENLQATHG